MANQNYNSFSDKTQVSMSCWTGDGLGFNLITRLLSHICRCETEGSVLVFMTGWEDIGALLELLKVHPILGDTTAVQLLGCHGSMGTAEQVQRFSQACCQSCHTNFNLYGISVHSCSTEFSP